MSPNLRGRLALVAYGLAVRTEDEADRVLTQFLQASWPTLLAQNN